MVAYLLMPRELVEPSRWTQVSVGPYTGNESAPIQVAQRYFTGLAVSNAKI